MAMSDFAATIQQVTDRVRKHRFLYEQNEMATRTQVVEPILRYLGWDTEDPDKLQPNVSAEEGIPDYTLFLDGRKVLFVEAKKMIINVEDRQVLGQLAKYCNSEGMPYGLLTNGVVWILFRAFREGTTIPERVVWKVDIEHDDSSAVARKLSTVSTSNIGNIDALLTKLRILDEVWQSLFDDTKILATGVAPVFQALAKEAHPDFEPTGEEIEDFIEERLHDLLSPQPPEEPFPPELPGPGPKIEGPREMKIDRDTFPVRNSYEILVNTAEWLIKKSKLRRETCPVPSGHKRYLVNFEAKHRNGDDFRQSRRLSNGLFVETHYSTASCITNARKLLEHCGFNRGILEVR